MLGYNRLHRSGRNIELKSEIDSVRSLVLVELCVRTFLRRFRNYVNEGLTELIQIGKNMSQDLSQMFEQRLSACPNLQRPILELDRLIRDGLATSSALAKELQAIVLSGCPVEAVNYELTRAVSGQEDVWPGGEVSFILHRCPNFTLELRALLQASGHSRSQRLISAVCDQYYAPVAGTVMVRKFLQKSPDPNEALDPSRVLEDIGVTHLHAGDVFPVRAGYDLFEAESSSAASVLLILHRAPHLRYHWIYNRTTLAPEVLMSADQSSSRIQFALRILAELPHEDSLANLESLMDHPDHFIRWEAVRQSFSLSEDLGMRLLRRALNDVHPEVREAAEQTATELSVFTGTAEGAWLTHSN